MVLCGVGRCVEVRGDVVCCALECCGVLWCGVVWCGVVWCGVFCSAEVGDVLPSLETRCAAFVK